MDSQDKEYDIPEEIISSFITPLLKIDPDEPDHHKKLKDFIENLNKKDFEKFFTIIIENKELFLDQNFKLTILEYLDDKSPPKNAFFKTSFREIIGIICQEIVNLKLTDDLTQLNVINDVSLEYFKGNFKFYSIKLYHKNSSLTELIFKTKIIFDTIVGYNNYTIAHNIGLYGYEFDVFKTIINDEVSFLIHFNQNDLNFFSHNNIYITYWIWKDASPTTLEKITRVLEEFLAVPNMEPINFYRFGLSEKLIDTIKLKIKKENIKERSNDSIAEINSLESKFLINILSKLDDFNQKYDRGNENNFRNDLARFLEGAGYIVEENYDVEGGGHVDLLVNEKISMQLKIVDGKPAFDNVTGQAINDLSRFSISLAVIFDITNNRRYFKKYHKKNNKGIFYYVFY